MKINCYICTTVVSLPSHTFSRDPSSFPPLHPFFQRNEKPFHPPPPPLPPPLPPRHLFDSLSKVHNPPYLSISALPPTLPPEAASSTRFNLRLVPVVSLEQSIPISRESVLNLAPSRAWNGSEHSEFLDDCGQRNSIHLDGSVYARVNNGFNRDCCFFFFSMEASYLGYLGRIRWNGWKINTWNVNFGRKKKEFFHLRRCC